MDPQTIWRYEQDLARLAARICPNPHDAQDITQSALVKAVEAHGTFRGEATIRTWLHRIATNECLMMLRKRRPEPADDLDGLTVVDPTVRVDTPEDLILVAETQGEVLTALAALPDRTRTAVMIVDGCGLSYQEAADAMDSTPAAVRSLLFRGRQTLRAALDRVER